MTEVTRASTCTRCKRPIFLVKTGKVTYKWMTDPEDKDSWHCGYDPDWPVRGHTTAKY